ncbi:GDP-mannose 4,6-dehydratase [Homoserinibacter sp. GY 40078]|nr:GDP-mannose 4,6-dehydratase [Homoserinibacter sp. GY 40078]
MTGATGQDGSYLAERLLAEGAEVHAVVRDDTTGEEPLAEGAVAHSGDLRDADGLRHLVESIRPDLVVNLGGISSVATSWAQPELTALVTGASVATLLDACWRLHDEGAAVRFVQASSSEIFGHAAESPQTEDTPLRPVSPYGAAKAYAHHLVGVYRMRGLHASSAILYNHESLRRPETFVTRKITRAAARISLGLQDTLELGALDAERDWGWAPDYVDAIARIAGADHPGDYIVATGTTHSVRDFVEAAFRAAGIDDWEGRVRTDPRFVRPVETPRMCGDASRIRRDLGWEPTTGFDQMVRAMVEHDLRIAEREIAARR